MLKRSMRWAGLFLMLAYCVAGQASVTHAQSLQSPNYRFDESAIGSGSMMQSSSANYQASSATGDLAIGESASGNYQIDSGSQTTNDPTLSFAVEDLDANFGSFTASDGTVTTAQFSVSNYTSYGYIVQIVGQPPTNGNHTITAMPSAGPSQPGVEQFGINLVANTSPTSVGANPVNAANGTGAARPNYATSNQYRYVSGDTIASAPKSSGKTTYTLSYLVNVASLTPGGKYTSNQTIIVTGTY